ncbi:unnamed protein product [Pseudo-nitzschia multistriata]|uniref:Helicase C-terminal domain-containing protein n=1 Tax=Pseudo-nitzschia multistriata TaxID=183589 RepID=A0A448ZAN8_9STRA|nr:unnamed protein product [Pseudo-nitzschia multistriata]
MKRAYPITIDRGVGPIQKEHPERCRRVPRRRNVRSCTGLGMVLLLALAAGAPTAFSFVFDTLSPSPAAVAPVRIIRRREESSATKKATTTDRRGSLLSAPGMAVTQRSIHTSRGAGNPLYASATIESSVEAMGDKPNSVAQKEDDGRSDEIVADILDFFRQHGSEKGVGVNEPPRKRGNVQLVAGSGKTYIAWKVMEGLLMREKSRTRLVGGAVPELRIGVFVTPFLNLIDQALSNREAHQILESSNSDDNDSVAIDTMVVASKTGRANEKCSTEESEIRGFLTSTRASNGEHAASIKLLACTYSSLHKLGSAIRTLREERNRTDVRIDVCVFDEAHRMEGLTRSNSKQHRKQQNPRTSPHGSFAYGLYDSNIDIQNRLFMTGTPHNFARNATVVPVLPTKPSPEGDRVFLKKYGAEANEEESNGEHTKESRIRSFSDETLFGPCLARNTYRESVEQNITVPIGLFGVDMGVFQEYDNDFANGAIGDDNENFGEPKPEKDYYLPLAIQSAFQKLNVSHAVTFHSTNQRAREFLSLAEDVFARNNFDIDLFNMDCKTPPEERRLILKQAAASPRSLITNCKLLSMGVDEAWLDLVVIADPVRSTVDGRQMIGRVGRKAPGKTKGYVVVPVPVLEGDGLEENRRNNHAYQRFVTTFHHMVHIDEELRQEVLIAVQTSEELGRPLHESEYPSRILEAFNLPMSIPAEVKDQLMDCAIVAYNNNDYGDDSSKTWDRMVEFLRIYKTRNGDCNVPQSYTEETGECLGSWLNAQRLNMRRGLLDPHRRNTLTELGVVWDTIGQKWEDMYTLLAQYKEREGHCNVPRNHQEGPEQNLGAWVNRQRIGKRKGKLDPVHEDRLAKLGIVWDVLAQQWDSMYTLLLQYKDRTGNCNVPFKHEEDGEKLGMWLNTQRHNRKNGDLGTERIQKLESAGVVWDPSGQQWGDMYTLLLQYKERTGDCNVPLLHEEDGKKLGHWLNKQRRDKKTGTLAKEKVDLLSEHGVVWNLTAQQWKAMFKLLVHFRDREGHCNVPQMHREKGEKLGTWLVNQRTSRRLGKLDAELETKLMKLGVVWDTNAQQWDHMHSLLVQYRERNGDCNVRRSYEEGGKKLGNWVNTQRSNKKLGKLSKERIQRLEDAEFLWTSNKGQ